MRDGLIFLGLSVILNPEHRQKWPLAPPYDPAVLATPGDIAESFDIVIKGPTVREVSTRKQLCNFLDHFRSEHVIEATRFDARI